MVCPRIDETQIEEGDELEAEPGIPMAAAETIAKNLIAMPVFSNVRIGLMHGRMSSEDKASAMAKFSAGELDVLVSGAPPPPPPP